MFVLINLIDISKDLHQFGLIFQQFIWLLDRFFIYLTILYFILMYEFVMGTLVVILVSSKHVYSTLNSQLQSLINKLHYGCLTQATLSKQLTLFRRDHVYTTKLICFADKSFLSNFLTIFFLTTLPANVYLISIVATSDFTLLESSICVFILALHGSNAYCFLLPTVQTNIKIHKGHKYFPKIQPIIHKTILYEKLKHQLFYEILHTDNPLGYTVNYFGHISTRSIFEVNFAFHKSKNFRRILK